MSDLGAAASSADTPRTPRKSFSKPGTFGRKRDGGGSSFRAGSGTRHSTGGDARPPRKNFASGTERRPDRGERPAFGGPRTPGSYSPRPSRGPSRGPDFSGKPRSSKPAGFSGPKDRFSGKPFAGRPKDRGERSSTSDTGKRMYRKFDAPRDRPARPFSSDRPGQSASAEGSGRGLADYAPRKFAGKKTFAKPGGFAGKKPFGKPAGDFKPRKFNDKPSAKPGGFKSKKPFSKQSAKSGAAFTGKPVNTFAKFAGNNKPFGKRPPARKFKPRKDESAG